MSRKFNREKATLALKRAAQMPALFHTLPNEEFDCKKSEVLRWLGEQPEILNAMFNYYNSKGAIRRALL